MNYYVYILSNATNVTIYTGVTKDLAKRVYAHKNHLDPNSFTSKYNIHKLVYYETTSDIKSAIAREKEIKGWRRSKKNDLISAFNPQWNDLYPTILE